MKNFIHKLAHIFGMNYGKIETFWEGEILMIGFRCECGELSSTEPVYSWKSETDK